MHLKKEKEASLIFAETIIELEVTV